ncbi:MAG TPA: aminopeptidase P family protein [Firmicutes bacterium]|nr:aminopeptidase P family protein [Bacillota bacterium]
MQSRLDKLRGLMSQQELDACLIMQPENRRYISGFTGSAGALVITSDAAILVTDFRYITQAQDELTEGFVVESYDKEIVDAIATLARNHRLKNLAVEADYVTLRFYDKLKTACGGVDILPREGLVESLRAVKDPYEIEKISEAARLGDEAFSHILGMIKPGIPEMDIALEIEWTMRKKGALRAAFDVIVASGSRGALPHAKPSHRPLEPGDLVVMDFGAVVDGYCGDMTRTVCVGKASAKAREIYQVVSRAQAAGLAAVRAGRTGRDVDCEAREIIREAGYGDYFGHGLGHGVGLAVHESPRLSQSGTDPLPCGAVVTVEPGIYIPGWGGVRIEDLVVVRETGCQILTRSTKELLELD